MPPHSPHCPQLHHDLSLPPLQWLLSRPTRRCHISRASRRIHLAHQEAWQGVEPLLPQLLLLLPLLPLLLLLLLVFPIECTHRPVVFPLPLPQPPSCTLMLQQLLQQECRPLPLCPACPPLLCSRPRPRQAHLVEAQPQGRRWEGVGLGLTSQRWWCSLLMPLTLTGRRVGQGGGMGGRDVMW